MPASTTPETWTDLGVIDGAALVRRTDTDPHEDVSFSPANNGGAVKAALYSARIARVPELERSDRKHALLRDAVLNGDHAGAAALAMGVGL